MPLPYSSSSTSSTRLLYRVNSWGVVFIALSWWVLITTWSSRCERKSTPCRAHRLIATCDKNQPENRDWWSKILKNDRAGGGKLFSRSSFFFPLLFLLFIMWLIGDRITTTVPGDTFHSHTFHFPEMYWQTQTPVCSVTSSCCPITLETKKVKKVEDTQGWERRETCFQRAFPKSWKTRQCDFGWEAETERII